jgi:hypothetical protein
VVFFGYQGLKRARFWGLDVTGSCSFSTVAAVAAVAAAAVVVLMALVGAVISLGIDVRRQGREVGRRGSCIHVCGFVSLSLLLPAEVPLCLLGTSGGDVHFVAGPFSVDAVGVCGQWKRSDGKAYLYSFERTYHQEPSRIQRTTLFGTQDKRRPIDQGCLSL